MARVLTSVRLFWGSRGSGAWGGTAPGAGGERLRSRKRFWGGEAASSAPGSSPYPRAGEGNDLRRPLNNGPRVVCPPGRARLLFLGRSCQPLAVGPPRSVYSYFRLFALCVIAASARFPKYFTARPPPPAPPECQAVAGEALPATMLAKPRRNVYPAPWKRTGAALHGVT